MFSAYFAFIKIEILFSLFYTPKTPRMNIVSNTFTALPAEICNIIYQYYKLPFADELKVKMRCYLFGSIRVGLIMMEKWEWVDHKRSRRDHMNLWGDSFYVHRGKIYYPNRGHVIVLMKKNNLFICEEMETRTMIKQLIKL